MGAEVQLPALPSVPYPQPAAAVSAESGGAFSAGAAPNERPPWLYGPPGRGLCAADGLRTPFSNYTSGFKALLDYVWFDPERMEVGACMGGGAGRCMGMLVKALLDYVRFDPERIEVGAYMRGGATHGRLPDGVARGDAHTLLTGAVHAWIRTNTQLRRTPPSACLYADPHLVVVPTMHACTHAHISFPLPCCMPALVLAWRRRRHAHVQQGTFLRPHFPPC